jgi:hypothetical protein
MRSFTRLTNAFSKTLESNCHALPLYFVAYNFIKMHKTLLMTPAIVAGVTDKLWSMEDIVELIDADAPKSGSRGRYKMRQPKRDGELSTLWVLTPKRPASGIARTIFAAAVQ